MAVPRLAAMLALAACGRPDPSPADPIGRGGPVCADPEARDEAVFDRVTLPGEAVDQPKFWSGGVTIGDFDGDGHQDLVLPSSDAVRLLRGDGRGGFVEAVGAIPGLDWTRAAAAAAADYDGDGDLDLFVTRYGTSDTLLVNEGGTFHDGTAAAGVGGPGGTYGQGATWADLDLDGDLDLVVAGHGYFDDSGPELIVAGPPTPSRLYLNRGDGTFADRSDQLPFEMQDGYTFVAGVVDLDGDEWPDLYFVNDFAGTYRPSQAGVWRGDRYELVGPEAGLNPIVSGMGLGIGDLDGDGVDDFVLPGWSEIGWLMSLDRTGIWVDAAQAEGVVPRSEQVFGWGVDLADFDNDGWVEVPVAFGFLETSPFVGQRPTANPLFQPDAMYHRRPEDGVWVDVALATGSADDGVGRGIAVADLNEDGWLDLVTRNLEGPTTVLLSRCGEAAWLRVTVRGPPPNLAGVGATVEVTAGGAVQTRRIRAGGTSYLSQDPSEAWFGLGGAEAASVTVRWPDGDQCTLEAVPTRQWVEVGPDCRSSDSALRKGD